MGSNALNSDGDLLLTNDGNDLGVMKADNAKSIKNEDLSLHGITLPDSKLPGYELTPVAFSIDGELVLAQQGYKHIGIWRWREPWLKGSIRKYPKRWR